MRFYVYFQTLCNPRTWKIGRYFYCWIFQFLLKFGDHLKLKIRRGAQILVLQSHSEVVKMSSILFFGAESSTKITGGRKPLKNKFLQKFLQGSTFTKNRKIFRIAWLQTVQTNRSHRSSSRSILFFWFFDLVILIEENEMDQQVASLLSLDQSCQTRCMGCVTMTAHKTI